MTVADALATLRSALPNGYPRAALARVEDEIARLEQALANGDNLLTQAGRQLETAEADRDEALGRSDEHERDANRTLDRAKAAEAEVARLKDGLREIKRQKPDGTAARAVQIARALLAKDGAAREDYEACCDHDRIVGRDVICELPAGHGGEHRMGGARWLRAEDGAA